MPELNHPGPFHTDCQGQKLDPSALGAEECEAEMGRLSVLSLRRWSSYRFQISLSHHCGMGRGGLRAEG